MPLKWGQGPGQEAEEESQKCGLYLQDPPASLHTPTSLTLQTRAPDGPSELRIRLQMLQGHGPLTNISEPAECPPCPGLPVSPQPALGLID